MEDEVATNSTKLESVEVVPEASRIMEGLRDTGYNFNTAVADIVDNSIAAGARRVDVGAYLEDGKPVVFIADDGCGMTPEGLVGAMKYGATRDYGEHSLGKFGLGLKTASTSCCRRLTVASRAEEGGEVTCAVWDLDHIASVGAWNLQVGPASDEHAEMLEDCAGEGTGTVVVWEECDRLLSARYTNPRTKTYQAAFERALKSLEQHLAMVFQRFLDHSDRRAPDIDIFLNGGRVVPWDPFCAEIEGCNLGRKQIAVEGTDARIAVSLNVIPASRELPTDEGKRRVQPSHKNKDLKDYPDDSLSGFYVYRENRLLHWGEWFGMSHDFHDRLCRFELSFGAELDELFQVDIKKSRVLLSGDLRDELVDAVNPVKKEGERRYRSTENKAAKSASANIHEEANRTLLTTPLVPADRLTQSGENEVEVANRYGRTRVPNFCIVTTPDGQEVCVEPADWIEDALLWEPALINGKAAVRLNTSHEFYKRFYGANTDGRTIAAMDYLLWSLAQAENDAVDPEACDNLREYRIQASTYLRRLARTLPEVSPDDFEGAE